jgi:hypothetical protein
MSYEIDDEFIEMAVELIDETIPEPNAIWRCVANDTVADPDKPWLTTLGQTTDFDVRILFNADMLQNRQFVRYLADTEVPVGNVNALMYRTEFEPTLKDIVIDLDGRELKVLAVNAIKPIEQVILYLLRLGA